MTKDITKILNLSWLLDFRDDKFQIYDANGDEVSQSDINNKSMPYYEYGTPITKKAFDEMTRLRSVYNKANQNDIKIPEYKEFSLAAVEFIMKWKGDIDIPEVPVLRVYYGLLKWEKPSKVWKDYWETVILTGFDPETGTQIHYDGSVFNLDADNPIVGVEVGNPPGGTITIF